MDDDGVEGGLGMVTATAWVPRGFAAQFPIRKEFDEEEFSRIAGLARGQLEDAKDDLEIAEKGDDDDEEEEEEDDDEDETKEGTDGGVTLDTGVEGMDIDEGAAEVKKPKQKKKKEVDDDDLREYDLDNYDNDDDEVVYGSDDGEGQSMGMFNSIKSLAYHQPGEADPYITLADDEEDEEKEELQILATDNLLLVAKTEDEVSHLEVYVYEDESDNLYVHHDIMLPAVPLCVEWLDLPVGSTANPNTDPDSRGNFCAIGTMDPDIEIWDLDVIDCMYPNAILGAGGAPGEDGKKNKKKKKKTASKQANDTHHVDAVIALAANRSHRNLLASGSADKTIKLWDLNTATCAKSYSYHTDKVCALAWHPRQSTVLLSGSWDRTVVASDMRAPDAKKVPRWGVESDVETLRWDPHDSNYFYVTTESGMVHFHDIRNTPAGGNLAKTKPVWTLQAHHKPCSAFDVSPHIPGLIATGSGDRTVKLWTVGTSEPGVGGAGPSMVVSRDLDVGQVFSVGWAPDKEVGFRLSVGGSKGLVRVWDTSTNAAVRRVFSGRVAMPEGDVQEKIIGVDSDSDDDEDGDEEEGEEEEEEEEEVVQKPAKKSKKKKGGDGWESMEE
ncbi:WD40-repeat-containing domain protein [Peziza echinospora]|nr:WD40-repeat-containing domain protein [Peziza echinospora]